MRQEKTIKGLWAALDKNNLISKELGDILDSNIGYMDKKLFINESKNQARKSGSRYSQDIRNNLPFIYIFIAQELTNFPVRKTLHFPHPANTLRWSLGHK